MRLPTLMMAVVMVAVFGAGCAKLRPKPRPAPAPQPPRIERPVPTEKEKPREESISKEPPFELSKEDKKQLENQEEILDRLEKVDKKLNKMREKLATKRAEGFDVGKAEEIFKDTKASFEKAEQQYTLASISKDFASVEGLVSMIEDFFEKIDQEIEKAPRFREKTRPKAREFADDRDTVIKRLGHPDPTNVRVGPHSSFSFPLMNPTQFLSGAIQWGCYDPRSPFSTFTLQTPPKILIMEYHKGQEGTYQFVFAEDNHCTQLLTTKNQLKPEERDQALSCLCMSQGSGYENYKLIGAYKGKMVGMPEDVLRQLLSSEFRFADQFGLGALSDLAKGGATLSDLELVSVVYSIKLGPLNKKQDETLRKIHAKIRDKTGEMVWDPNKGVLIYDQEKTEKIKKAFSKVAGWREALLPQKNDKKELLKQAGKDDAELAGLLDGFEDAIGDLAKEIQRIQKEVLRFRREFDTEVGFRDNESPIFILTAKGVAFETEPASDKTLFKKDQPRLKIKPVVYYVRNKYDTNPVVFDKFPEFIVTEASKLISIAKEYERLTTFMIGWPSMKPLPPGNYILELTVTDEIREKAIIHKIRFVVVSAGENNDKKVNEKGGQQ